MINVPTMCIVIGSAAITAINPFTLSSTLVFISRIIGYNKTTKRLVAVASIFAIIKILMYLAVGLAITLILGGMGDTVQTCILLCIGSLLTIVGLFSIKEYFWYGKWSGISLSEYFSGRVHHVSKRLSHIKGALLFGLIATIAEITCIGGQYLAIASGLRSVDPSTSAIYLLTYALIITSPILLIAAMVVNGVHMSNIVKWKEESKGAMQLFSGVLLVLLGWMLMLMANGTVHFG